jgi:hypothetical protein
MNKYTRTNNKAASFINEAGNNQMFGKKFIFGIVRADLYLLCE